MSKCLKRALFQTHPNWCRSNHFLVVITAAIAVIAAIESCSIAVDIASVEPVVG